MEKRDNAVNTKSRMLVVLKRRLNRHPVAFLMLAFTLIVVVLIGGWFYTTYFSSGNEQQFSEYRSEYQDLKKKKPTSTQTTEQANYYQLLASTAAKAGDFKGAVNSFEERKKILGNKLPVIEYLDVALFYCRMDDKEGAVRAIQEGAGNTKATELDKARFESAIKSINEQGCDAWVLPLDQQ